MNRQEFYDNIEKYAYALASSARYVCAPIRGFAGADFETQIKVGHVRMYGLNGRVSYTEERNTAYQSLRVKDFLVSAYWVDENGLDSERLDKATLSKLRELVGKHTIGYEK